MSIKGAAKRKPLQRKGPENRRGLPRKKGSLLTKGGGGEEREREKRQPTLGHKLLDQRTQYLILRLNREGWRKGKKTISRSQKGGERGKKRKKRANARR